MIRKTFFTVTIILFSTNFFSQEFIDDLINRMTIEEKVGQMTQINLGFLSSSIDQHDGKVKNIDTLKLKSAILDYKVGSILNTAGSAYSIERWHQIITLIQDYSMNSTLKIPIIYGIDAIHGVTYTKGSTLFPHNIGLGATRNPSLAREIGKITAMETRASGIRWNFDPVLDVGRNPLWPRFCETFGEDPFLVSVMGSEIIKGYEEDGLNQISSVASCMKHFLGYSVPASGKDRTESYISDISLWQKHIPSFKAAIEAGASTIMINSSMINDIPVHGSYELLTELLRDKLGFKGMIVTDWQDIIRLHERHKIAKTQKEAVKIAIQAGIDMSMVPNSFSFCNHLVDLVKDKEISEERINESVRRILVLKYNLGLFDNPYPEKEAVKNFGLKRYRDIALKSARESIVLLKNNDALPLPTNKKYLLLGPGVNCLSSLNGSWSYSWQGDNENVYPEDYNTILDVFKDRFKKQVYSNSTSNYDSNINYKIDFNSKIINEIDYVIMVLGENAYAESPGNIDDLVIDKSQIELVKKAKALNKKIIIVLNEGRPRIIHDIIDDVEAVLLAFYPGSMGAEAIVDVLFGNYNPSGILPFTYPAKTGDIFTYDHKFLSAMVREGPNNSKFGGYRPEFKFGHGLSYSEFKVDNFKISHDTITLKDTLYVDFDITNNSDIKATKLIDLFIKDHYASYAPDVRNLKAFTKIDFDKREKKHITMKIDKSSLFYYNENGQKIFEKGFFSVIIEEESRDFYLDL